MSEGLHVGLLIVRQREQAPRPAEVVATVPTRLKHDIILIRPLLHFLYECAVTEEVGSFRDRRRFDALVESLQRH